MQSVLMVACSGGPSLRDKIAKDAKIEQFGLQVMEQRRPGRASGWTKVHSSEGEYGAINIQWHPAASMLSCRVVTRKPGKPDRIIGAFVTYLLARHRRQIFAINIYPD
jgi:hypothetical protein